MLHVFIPGIRLPKIEERTNMINVIASIHVKAGKRSDFLEIFRSNVPKVREEAGCIEYFPAVDILAGLPTQNLDEDVITVIEKWESLEALHIHLNSSHMEDYRKKVKDIVESVSLKILQEV